MNTMHRKLVLTLCYQYAHTIVDRPESSLNPDQHVPKEESNQGLHCLPVQCFLLT